MRDVAELLARVADLERRVSSMILHAPVAEVSGDGKSVRLRIGEQDGVPLLSPWIPHSQMNGALKFHTPATVGQQMTMLSPSGDFRQGSSIPLTWSDANPSPSDANDANAATFGAVRFDLASDGLTITVGGTVVVIDGGGVHVTGANINLDGPTAVTGASLSHNGKNVGDDHKHKDSMPGPALTGPPA